jgi:hypothetical protein
MSINKVIEPLAIAIQANVPVNLWGGSGVGKTSAITALAEALLYHLESMSAANREPSDFLGIPVRDPESGCVLFAPLGFARRLNESKKGILFIDEVTTCLAATQAALMRVANERYVGEEKLKAHVSVVCAANPPEIAANGQELVAPLSNRFCHLFWVNDTDVWIEGMLSSWPKPVVKMLPENWKDNLPTARTYVTSFIRQKKGLANVLPKNESEMTYAWPSYRTWDMAATLLAACISVRADVETETQLIAGCVGTGAALEMLQWRRENDLPDFEMLLADPSKYVTPKRADLVFAVLAGVVSNTLDKLQEHKNGLARWEAAWEIVSKASKDGHKDVATACVRPLVSARTSKFVVPKAAFVPFVKTLADAGIL